MSRSDSFPNVVHFSGSWTREERDAVQKAVGAVEGHNRVSIPAAGAPWVCVKQVYKGGYSYFMHRIGQSQVIAGRSLEELLRKLRSSSGIGSACLESDCG